MLRRSTAAADGTGWRLFYLHTAFVDAPFRAIQYPLAMRSRRSLRTAGHSAWRNTAAVLTLFGPLALVRCDGSYRDATTEPADASQQRPSTSDGAAVIEPGSVDAAPHVDAGLDADASTVAPPEDRSVEGQVIPSPSRVLPGLVVTPARPGALNGAGPFLNAYAAADVETKCINATPRITRLWQHNIDFATYQSNGNNDYPYLAPDEAMTWRFVAPPEGTTQILQYNEGTQVHFVSGFLSLSTTACDFDIQKIADPRESCYRSEVNGIGIYYRSTVTKSNVQASECQILPGRIYYLNVRMQDARPAAVGGHPTEDSCRASGFATCGGYVQIR